MKVSFICGTRPEAIKLAPVINLFKKQSDFETEVCFTGQHKEMVEQILPIFGIEPDVNLELMTSGQSLSYFTGRALQTLSSYIEEHKPDHIFVQGDTATVFAGALAGFFNQKKVHHVEAGLRTNNKFSPFPEEINRVLTGRLADYHFPPTAVAKQNLLKEGILEKDMRITGNTGIDALLQVYEKIQKNQIKVNLSMDLQRLVDKAKGKIILVTAHRRESFGDGFDNICKAIRTLAEKYRDNYLIYPVHLNPKVRKPVFEYLSDRENILLCDPLDYLEFIHLMSLSRIILTDSGGIQEEAPSLNKPLIVMRETTERPEGVEAGCSKLVGTNVSLIVNSVSELIDSQEKYESTANLENPYGNGKASELILEFFKSKL